ncbi:AAA domain-containing protein [Pseudonocardia sichuanensis]
MAAEWAAHVIEAVEQSAAQGEGPGRPAAWSDLGVAVPDGDDGQLVVHLRGDGRENMLLSPCLSGEQGPEHEPAYPVEELRAEDGVVRLRPPPGLSPRSRRLWARSPSARFLHEALRDGLRAAGPAALAEALAQRRLAGAPTSRAAADGLPEEQVEAFRACLGPGVRLVWAPPGTGATQVLARAVEALAGEGKRVLLVATADTAVDDVLHAAVRRMAPAAGTAVRVGPPARREIGVDVQLERLAAPASREVDEERASVAAALRQVEEVDEEVERLRAELGEHDEQAYRAAVARIDAERVLDELGPRLEEAQDAAETARRAAVTAATALREALAARAELDPVRDALEDERRAQAALDVIAQRQEALRRHRAELFAEDRASRWRARRQHRREVDAAIAELQRYNAAAAEGRRRWLDLQLHARAVIGERSRADVDAVDRRSAAAEVAMAAADEGYRRARDALAALRAAHSEAEAIGPPTAADWSLVVGSESRGLPGKHARLQELLTGQDDADALRDALSARHRELVEQARGLRAVAVARIVGEASVVATTLARSRIHPALTGASFDAVLVHGAGSAALAEVLLVLRRATTTAVLVGDFLECGPEQAGGAGPELQPWTGATCFAHVGIATPADAVAEPGCVALTHQSRFGAALRRLANEAGYEGLRDAEELPDAEPQPDTEVVLIDLATVPDATADRLGTALPRVLAALHAPDGPVAVVAPCAPRAEAVRDTVRDHGGARDVAVGTVRDLQGREFPTVVVDLVDGAGPGFGPAVALAGRRLYLLADGTAVRAAETGALRVLRDGVERGEVHTWSAAALLGEADPPPGPADTFAELGSRLREPDIPEQREGSEIRMTNGTFVG